MKTTTTRQYTIEGRTISVHLRINPEYSVDELLEHLVPALEANVRFYSDIGLPPHTLSVTLLYARAEYDAVIGYETKPWASGYSTGTTAYLFHPDKIESETSHTRDTFPKTLTHEISHIFTRSLFSTYLWWVTEGVAQYLGGQSEYKPLEQRSVDHFLAHSLDHNAAYVDFLHAQGHQISKRLGYAVADTYGVSALRELLAVQPGGEHARTDIARVLHVDGENVDDVVIKLIETSPLDRHEGKGTFPIEQVFSEDGSG